MAKFGVNAILLLLVGAALICAEATSVAVECDSALVELVPCSDSLNGPNAVSPNGDCCMAVGELLLIPECLCFAASTAQGFDKHEILNLPKQCKFPTKANQTCDGFPIPSYEEPLEEEVVPKRQTK